MQDITPKNKIELLPSMAWHGQHCEPHGYFGKSKILFVIKDTFIIKDTIICNKRYILLP